MSGIGNINIPQHLSNTIKICSSRSNLTVDNSAHKDGQNEGDHRCRSIADSDR